MEDEFISQGQVAAVKNHPEGITNDSVARYSPSLVTGDTRTMVTD
jgi:hypothetical protein